MKKFLFFTIIIVALVLRFALLTSVPPSASLDEATIGWNAYSILHTGNDEYGYHLPILLRAYDDYRPALYVYLVIPFVKLLGLSILAVRLPSVILSMITVIATYFLALQIFPTIKLKKWIALSAMGFMAISPFHIYVSRLGHEVNPGLTFVVLGTLCFFYSMNKGKWMILGAGIFWSLSFYTYQSEKVFVPLLVVVLGALFWKKLWGMKKQVLLGLVISSVITLPIFFASLTPGALLRLKGTSVFTDNPAYDISAKHLLQDKQSHNVLGEIIDNRRVTTVSIFVNNYLTHFSPFWWYGNSGDEQFKVPYLGLFYIWEFPFLIVGFFALWRNNLRRSIKLLPVFWILSVFVAPGLTTQAPHAMRSYNLLPIPQLIEGFGLVWLFEMVLQVKSPKNRTLLFTTAISLLVICVAISIGVFSYLYFYLFPKHQSSDFEYALGNAIVYAANHKNDYKHIYITNRNNGYQSYMLYLYYTQYDPVKYAQMGGTISGGFSEIHTIDHITFQVVARDAGIKDTLYITNSQRTNTSVKQVFKSLDGSNALYAWTIKTNR